MSKNVNKILSQNVNKIPSVDSQCQNVTKILNVKTSTRFSKLHCRQRFPMSKWRQDSQHQNVNTTLSVNVILHPGCPQTFHTKIHTLSRPFLVKIQKPNLRDSSPTGLLIHHISPTGLLIHHILCFTVHLPKHCPLMVTINTHTHTHTHIYTRTHTHTHKHTYTHTHITSSASQFTYQSTALSWLQ